MQAALEHDSGSSPVHSSQAPGAKYSPLSWKVNPQKGVILKHRED